MWMKKSRALILAVAMAVGVSGCLADIRPRDFQEVKEVSASDEARGRELLERAAKAHGIEKFSQIQTYTMRVRDQWRGVMPRMLNPWPDHEVDVRLSYRAGSFDGRAEFLDGSLRGHTWGLQSWRAYQVDEEQALAFEPNGDAEFILPAIQYLNEFVFRDHSSQIVTYMGRREVSGKSYEAVFVTWDGLSPSKHTDQYIAYIDPDTDRVDKLYFTVRDQMKMATGAIHYEDVRDVDGVLFAFKQYVTLNVDQEPEAYAHLISVSSVELDAVEASVFSVNDELSELGDVKP